MTWRIILTALGNIPVSILTIFDSTSFKWSSLIDLYPASDLSDDFWTAVIVAKAAIHREVITDFEMDTGLRRYDVALYPNVIG